MASAVLLAMSPTRMAVWDRRVSTALKAIDRSPKSGPGHYARYLEVVLDLAESIVEMQRRFEARALVAKTNALLLVLRA